MSLTSKDHASGGSSAKEYETRLLHKTAQTLFPEKGIFCLYRRFFQTAYNCRDLSMPDTRLSLDEKHMAILRELIQDSSRKQSEIAKLLGISQSKLSERKDYLIRNNIIKRYTVDLDYSLLGYGTIGFIHISVVNRNSDAIDPMIEFLSSFDEVIEIHELFGKEHDYFLKIMCRHNERLREIGKFIAENENVDSANLYTHAVARTLINRQGVPF